MKKIQIIREVTEQAHTQGRIPEGMIGYRTKITYEADTRWAAKPPTDYLVKEYGSMIAVRFIARELGFGGDQFIHLWIPADAFKEI